MKLIKRSLAAILALVMCLSLLPINVFAVEAEEFLTARSAACGLEAHIHSEDCYAEADGVYDCPVAAQHDHSGDVYDEETGELLCCALAEHICGDSCYVYCGKEQHIHDESCAPDCPIEAHEHTAACFQKIPVLVCGMDEHEHTDACFPAADTDFDSTTDPDPVEGEEIAEEPADIQAFLDVVEALKGLVIGDEYGVTIPAENYDAVSSLLAALDRDMLDSIADSYYDAYVFVHLVTDAWQGGINRLDPDNVTTEEELKQLLADSDTQTITLGSNITVASTLYVSGGKTLNLNNCTVTLTGGVGGNLFDLNGTGNSLTVNGDGTLTCSNGCNNIIEAKTGATLTLNGGTIDAKGNGRGIWLDNAAFTMTGGNVTGGSNSGVAGNNFTMDMSGGTITGNTSGGNGGGIRAGYSSTITLRGAAEITGNTANGTGGGISTARNNNQDSVTITIWDNAQVTNNIAKNKDGDTTNNRWLGGGGIFTDGGVSSRVIMHGGVISGNTAPCGGGIRTDVFIMDGGTITNNTASGASDNNTGRNYGNGGGVLIRSGNPDNVDTYSRITGGTIANNHAPNGGGYDIYVCEGIDGTDKGATLMLANAFVGSLVGRDTATLLVMNKDGTAQETKKIPEESIGYNKVYQWDDLEHPSTTLTQAEAAVFIGGLEVAGRLILPHKDVSINADPWGFTATKVYEINGQPQTGSIPDFEFGLTPYEDTSIEGPDGIAPQLDEVVKNDANGTITFENLPLPKSTTGTTASATYILKEIVPKAAVAGMTYDTTVYKITVNSQKITESESGGDWNYEGHFRWVLHSLVIHKSTNHGETWEPTTDGIVFTNRKTEAPTTKELTYTVEYYKDGELQTEDTLSDQKLPVDASKNSGEVELNTIAPAGKYNGYSFKETDPVDENGKVTVHDGGTIKVYYAQTYTVTYEARGGTIDDLAPGKNKVFTCFKNAPLPVVTVTRDRSTLLGWKVNNDKALMLNGTSVAKGTLLTQEQLDKVTVVKDVTLKAQWGSSINVYAVDRSGSIITDSAGSADSKMLTIARAASGQTAGEGFSSVWTIDHYQVNFQFDNSNMVDIDLGLKDGYVPLGFYCATNDSNTTSVKPLNAAAWMLDDVPGKTDVYVVLDHGYTIEYVVESPENAEASSIPAQSRTVYVNGEPPAAQDTAGRKFFPNAAVCYVSATLAPLPKAKADDTTHVFTGWHNENEGLSEAESKLTYDDLADLDANRNYVVTLTAKYVEKREITYTIEFYKDGEKVSADTKTQTGTVIAGQTLDVTETNNAAAYSPDKYPGYSLESLKNGDTPIENPPNEVSETTTVAARYVSIAYTISYVDADGTTPLTVAGNPTTYKVTDTVKIENEPTKEGFTFEGWLLQNSDGTYPQDGEAQKSVTFGSGVTGNRTYKAVWRPRDQWKLTVAVKIEGENGQLPDTACGGVFTGYVGVSTAPGKMALVQKVMDKVALTADSTTVNYPQTITVDGKQYAYLSGAQADITYSNDDHEATVTLVYSPDDWHDGKGPTDPDSETGGDGIPDKYQARVTYQVRQENSQYDHGKVGVKDSLLSQTAIYVEVFTHPDYGTPQFNPDSVLPWSAARSGYAVADEGYAFAYWQVGESSLTEYHADLSQAGNLTVNPKGTVRHIALFLPDTKGGEPDPDTTPDGIPDQWQVFVKYQAAQGSPQGASVTIDVITGMNHVKQVGNTLIYSLGNNTTSGTINRAGATAAPDTADAYTFKEWTLAAGGDPQKAGSNAKLDAAPAMSVTGGTTYTYTAHWRPWVTYSLTVNLVKDDEAHTLLGTRSFANELKEGSSWSVTLDKLTSEVTGSNGAYTYPASITVDGHTYAFDKAQGATSGTNVTADVTVTLIYSLDEKGGNPDPEKPDTPDGTPDKYQVFVEYVAESGSVRVTDPEEEHVKLVGNTLVYDLGGKTSGNITIGEALATIGSSAHIFSGWTGTTTATSNWTHSAADAKLERLEVENAQGGATYTLTAKWTEKSTFQVIVNLAIDDVIERNLYTWSLYEGTSVDLVETDENLKISADNKTKATIFKVALEDEEGANYAYDCTTMVTDENTNDITITVNYSPDNIGTDPKNPDKPDGTPDKYQVKVTYTAEGGSVSVDKAVVTLFAEDGKTPAEGGTGRLAADQIATATADTGNGYTQASETWTAGGKKVDKPTEATEIKADTHYVVSFTKNIYTVKVKYVDDSDPANELKEADDTTKVNHGEAYDVNALILASIDTKDGRHYVKESVTGSTTGAATGNLEVTVVYTLDEKGGTPDPDKPDTPDGTPDKYQVFVKYENGNAGSVVSTVPADAKLISENYLAYSLGENTTGSITLTGIAAMTQADLKAYTWEKWCLTCDNDVDAEKVQFAADQRVLTDTQLTDAVGGTTYTFRPSWTAKNQYTVSVQAVTDQGTPLFSGPVGLGSYYAGAQYEVKEDQNGHAVYVNGVKTKAWYASAVEWPNSEDKLENYIYVGSTEPGTIVDGDVVITLTYTLDNIGTDPKNPDKPDGTPDKYQVVVKYVSRNENHGTVTGSIKKVFTLTNDEGGYTHTGVITPGTAGIVTTGRGRYHFSSWAPNPNVELSVEGGKTYVYTADWWYNGGNPTPPTPPAPPAPPSGGDSTPTTTITDEDVPLAAAPGLNNTDHFAYIIGYEDNTVRPTNNITRAEVATIFFRLMTDEFRAENWSTTNSFPDVEEGTWYNNAVSTTVKAGLVRGYTDGTFMPTNNITRAEFAAIAARFLSDDAATTAPFSDTAGHWAEQDIARAVQAGWIKGYPDGTFHPNAYITRAEVMTAVNRMLDRIPDKDHLLPDMIVWADNPETAWYYEDVQEATNGHDYERDELGITEIWTALQAVRDWAALEAAWATANS